MTVSIPTRNRAGYLQDLLSALADQIVESGLSPSTLRVIVSDNASTDETPGLGRDFAQKLPHFSYSPNERNLGAVGNFIKCARLVLGTFGWIAGDDEILNPGALAHVLETLRDPALGLMINLDTNYHCRVTRPTKFGSFRDFAAECARVQPHILIEHTLVTSNVYRRDCFDQAAAENALDMEYLHMYGMVKGLATRGGAVFLSDRPVITVRERRAPAVDGEWPTNLERSWSNYLGWQRELMDLPELRPEAALAEVQKALFRKLLRHPLRFIWQNLPAIGQPQAYRYFFKRLWGHLRRNRPSSTRSEGRP